MIRQIGAGLPTIQLRPPSWRRLGLAAALLAGALLQTGMDGALGFAAQLPDFCLAILIVLAFSSQRLGTLAAAFLAGLVLDLLSGTVAGGQSLALMLALLPTLHIRFVLFGSLTVAMAVGAGLATIIYYLVFGLLLSRQGLDLPLASTLSATGLAVVLNLLLTVPAYWIWARFERGLARRRLPVANSARFFG